MARPLRIRNDVDNGVHTVPETMPNYEDSDYDRVLYHCPNCDRIHYVALECPPENAPTFTVSKLYQDDVWERELVLETAD